MLQINMIMLIFQRNDFTSQPNSTLRQDIIQQFHNKFHKDFEKTSRRIKTNFYQSKMKDNIKAHIRVYEVFLQHKVEQLSPAGLLQPLPIPNQVLEDISIDFIDGPPMSQGKSTIAVVVDRFSKYSHFILVAHPYTTVSIAQVIFL